MADDPRPCPLLPAEPYLSEVNTPSITKMTVVPGKREEMIGILKKSAIAMPGCFSYVVAKDSANQNSVWVTEV